MLPKSGRAILVFGNDFTALYWQFKALALGFTASLILYACGGFSLVVSIKPIPRAVKAPALSPAKKTLAVSILKVLCLLIK